MPETCRDIYDNKSQLLHQVGTSRHFLIFCSSTRAQRETTLAFPWGHRKLFHCWQLHPEEQYKGKLLLLFHVSNAYAKAPQYCMDIILFIEMVASWRGISTLLYLQPSTQYFIAFINSATRFGPSYESSSGYTHCSRYKYEWKWTFGICGLTDSKYSLSHILVS